MAPIARYYKYKDSDRIFAHYCQSCTSKLPQGYNPPNTYSSAMKDSKFPSYQAQYKRQYKPSTRKFYKRPRSSGISRAARRYSNQRFQQTLSYMRNRTTRVYR